MEIRIMAVPWNEQRAERARMLRATTNGRIVWDQQRNAWHTWSMVLGSLGDGAGIVLEDDALPVPGWLTLAERAVEEHPDDLIQFFSLRKSDIAKGSGYRPASSFLMNQCLYYPPGFARDLLAFSRNWHEENRHEHPTGYDICTADFLKSRKQRYWMHVPSLVDHEKWRSEINSRRPRNRQAAALWMWGEQ